MNVADKQLLRICPSGKVNVAAWNNEVVIKKQGSPRNNELRYGKKKQEAHELNSHFHIAF